MGTQPGNLKMLAPWKESYEKPRQFIKQKIHHFASKGPYSEGCGLSSTSVQVGELDTKELMLSNSCA